MSRHAPLYDITKSWSENLENGPSYNPPFPEISIPPKELWQDFLGLPLALPFGVPAGPLLSSQWISLAGKLGFCLLTYKTIRSYEHPSHPLPNILFAHLTKELAETSPTCPIHVSGDIPASGNISITNSFGNPSMSPNYLREDIAKAREAVKDGQILAVSVFGETKEEFVQAAILAKEGGAQVIEANFSCPNLKTGKGSLYLDPDSLFEISLAVKKGIGQTPLMIKVGVFPSEKLMGDVFTSAAQAGVGAIAGINTVSRPVINSQSEPALGVDRITSGICGKAICPHALKFVTLAHEIIHDNNLDLKLVGGGGISSPEEFIQFLMEGADVAMSATGMMWDPHIAARASHALNKMITQGV